MIDYKIFMSDPDLADEPMSLREVHAIRLAIHEKTKNMTPEQRIEYYRKSGEATAKRYGFKITANALPSGTERTRPFHPLAEGAGCGV
ncbi:MAG: hypothetical protein LBP68_08520 [Acidobacteriota bacterium]|jgi:hypothetical protein|nr:hypothetical protein [Acidobacteriota bacterium]